MVRVLDFINTLDGSTEFGVITCVLCFVIGVAAFMTARNFGERGRGFYIVGTVLLAFGFLCLFSTIKSCSKTEIKEPLECSSCHEEIGEEDSYCSNCGVRIDFETE